MARTYHIETYGCQMNVLDSDIVGGILARAGYSPAGAALAADVVLLNTCAVRGGAEERVLNRLRSLHGETKKRRGGSVVLGLLGCVAQAQGQALVEHAPFLDLVVGTDRYSELPELLDEVAERGRAVVEVTPDSEVTYEGAPRLDPSGVTGFVSVVRGCDMGCTFCIVPRTRGPERSRRPEAVLDEVRVLAEQEVREVTLLGQKVNAYRWQATRFADLLGRVAAAEGIERVRFTSPHPLWVTSDLVRALADTPEICPALHLPLQSGSAAVLERMKRGYTPRRFLRAVADLRAAIPDIGLSTDIIVGFPGESEADHRDTLELLRRVRFDSAFMFAYSPRPGTAAAEMEDPVASDVAQRRLREVIDIQEAITREINQAQVDRIARVLVEGPSKKRFDELYGRTPENRPVVFAGGPGIGAGSIVDLRIRHAYAHTLRAEPIGSVAREVAPC